RAQVVPGHVLHRDVGLVADAADLEDRDDVAVHERQRERRLLPEARDELRIGRELREDPLEHDRLPAAVRGTREPDFRHPADGEAAEQHVSAERQAGLEARRHGLAIFYRLTPRRKAVAPAPVWVPRVKNCAVPAVAVKSRSTPGSTSYAKNAPEAFVAGWVSETWFVAST